MSAAEALVIMDAVRGCLCTELAATPGGEPCFCSIIEGGPVVVADHCGCSSRGKCGQAWVRLVEMYPSAAFPSPDTGVTGCASPLVAVIEVGVYRCVPTMTAKGQPPTVEQRTNATIQQVADAGAMHVAIRCCDELLRRDVTVGRYTPRDSSGGCGGGVWPFTVSLARVR